MTLFNFFDSLFNILVFCFIGLLLYLYFRREKS